MWFRPTQTIAYILTYLLIYCYSSPPTSSVNATINAVIRPARWQQDSSVFTPHVAMTTPSNFFCLPVCSALTLSTTQSERASSLQRSQFSNPQKLSQWDQYRSLKNKQEPRVFSLDLDIHCTTFTGLRWRLRAVHKWTFYHYVNFFASNERISNTRNWAIGLTIIQQNRRFYQIFHFRNLLQFRNDKALYTRSGTSKIFEAKTLMFLPLVSSTGALSNANKTFLFWLQRHRVAKISKKIYFPTCENLVTG